jgi:hypothetical protein
MSTGCDKRKLTEVEVPDEGVQLTYDLAPGKAFDGHIRVANAIASPAGELYNAIEFDVALEVIEARDDRFFVKATVNGLRTDVRLPEGLPKEAGLSQQAAESANGTELRFFVDKTGEVSEAPQPPEDAPLPVKAIISLISTGLRGAFVKLPPGPIKAGDSWDTSPAEQPEGGTASGSGKMKGMAQDANTGENVAKLEYHSSVEKTGEAEGQSLKGSLGGTAKALFSQAGYAISIERRLSGDAAGMTLTINVDVDWKPRG